jgi:hypothetical protein
MIDYNKILSKYPPSYINNSRKIVRALLEKYEESPSQSLADEIKSLTGYDVGYEQEEVPF